VYTQIADISNLLSGITRESEEQEQSCVLVNNNVESISMVANSNAELAKQMEENASKLNQNIKLLSGLHSTFRAG
jgi:methyl-accepting chemotaxis protein